MTTFPIYSRTISAYKAPFHTRTQLVQVLYSACGRAKGKQRNLTQQKISYVNDLNFKSRTFHGIQGGNTVQPKWLFMVLQCDGMSITWHQEKATLSLICSGNPASI